MLYILCMITSNHIGRYIKCYMSSNHIGHHITCFTSSNHIGCYIKCYINQFILVLSNCIISTQQLKKNMYKQSDISSRETVLYKNPTLWVFKKLSPVRKLGKGDNKIICVFFQKLSPFSQLGKGDNIILHSGSLISYLPLVSQAREIILHSRSLISYLPLRSQAREIIQFYLFSKENNLQYLIGDGIVSSLIYIRNKIFNHSEP